MSQHQAQHQAHPTPDTLVPPRYAIDGHQELNPIPGEERKSLGVIWHVKPPDKDLGSQPTIRQNHTGLGP